MDNRAVRYIDDPDGLAALCERLGDEPWLALDTEFLREKTYYPRLCLIQVATPGLAACIDPLALDDLEPLLDVLYRPGIVKVFHAARQDLEIFHRLRGAVPAPVFDTQLAAPLLGHPDQIGYGNLVGKVLGHQLEKHMTRTDWSRRPLSAEQIDYALDDVIYLARLYPALENELARLGRGEWLRGDFDRLTDPDLYEPPAEHAWRRIRGGQKLRGARLSAMQLLAEWRERTARQLDRPRNWILRDDVLLNLARQRPSSGTALARIHDLPARTRERWGDTFIELIRASAERPPVPVEKAADGAPASPAQQATADLMMALVRLRAEEHTLNPAVLASRKDLERLAGGDRSVPVMQGWRHRLAGDDLDALLDGRLAFRIDHGRPDLHHISR